MDPSVPTEPSVSYRVTTQPASSIVPTPEAEGQGEGTEPSAAAVNACVPTKNCEGIVAPRVSWPGADLSGVNFSFAVLTGADLRSVRAALARFVGADLSGADLSGANASGASFSGADLSGANLAGTDLAGADLKGAILVGAILDGTDLDAVRFCNTLMPGGEERNDHC